MKAPPPADEIEIECLRRAQAGMQEDCTALVKCYERRVFALLSRMLIPKGRGALTRDLAQETFLRVFRALGRFEPSKQARLSTWILTIATRVALSELGKPRLVEERLEGAPALPEQSGSHNLEQRAAERRAVVRALGSLEPEQQAVLILREYHDLEYDEIARALQIEIGTVKSRLFRARAALGRALSEVE